MMNRSLEIKHYQSHSIKSILIILSILLISIISARACDICGCGAGNNYVGILPHFKKNIIGFRYRTNGITTQLSATGRYTYLTTQHQFYIAEVWGAFQIKNKWRIMATLPYQKIVSENQNKKSNIHDLGDATILVYYNVLQQKKYSNDSSNIWVHSLYTGAGVKTPTGKYNATNNPTNNNLDQLGSGSWDALFNIMYDIRRNDLGINANVQYKANGTNRTAHYKYGNKFTMALQPYYKVAINRKITIAPNAGILYDISAKDEQKKITVQTTGGSLLMFMGGIETQIKNITVGANFQIPMQQNLGSGSMRATNRLMLHTAISF